ncbi:DNA polymerase subunit beta, partial [Candidatus Calescamantes bacterium]|nr:DNA polymerase subunit beta [Candidatus Calescamantes bacterium]
PDSDIDILIISSEIPEGIFSQAEIKLEIKNKFPDAPFELHLITPEEYQNWYKKFIKNEFKEV